MQSTVHAMRCKERKQSTVAFAEVDASRLENGKCACAQEYQVILGTSKDNWSLPSSSQVQDRSSRRPSKSPSSSSPPSSSPSSSLSSSLSPSGLSVAEDDDDALSGAGGSAAVAFFKEGSGGVRSHFFQLRLAPTATTTITTSLMDFKYV